MPSFENAAPVLFIDTASAVGWTGLAVGGGGGHARWCRHTEQAGVGLFRGVERMLREAGMALAEVESAVFCEGPGSLLGVRIAAMAVRTWREMPRPRPLRVFGYRSLELLAAALVADGRAGPFMVVSDARRAAWNCLEVAAGGRPGPIVRRPATEPFPEGVPVFHGEEFPRWQALPPGAVAVPYRPDRLPALAAAHALLRETAAPDAFLTEAPSYRPWNPDQRPCP